VTVTEPSSISRVLRHPAASAESLESIALLLGAAFFVVGGAVSLLAFWGQDLAIAGPGSLGQYVGIGGAVTALIAFMLGRVLVARHRHAALLEEVGQGLDLPGARLHWFDLVALALAHAVIALLGWIGVADLLERSFVDAVVFTIPAAVLAGVAFALTAYVVFLSSVHLTPMLLSLVLAAFLVVGALASMLSASDPHWWQENLSALGMTDDVSALAFNLTLVIAGAIVTIIARYATAMLPTDTSEELRRRTLLRSGLVLIGIFLALVGVFPVDRFLLVHNTVATGMAVVFAAIVIGLRWLVPAMPRVFILLGYAYIGVIVVLAVFFAIGYYNLTAVELVAAVLIFSWIIVFLRNSGVVRPADGSVHEVRGVEADMRTGPDAAASDPVAVSS
jgi:hypothetical membrane protein